MDFNQLTEQQKTEPDELKMGQKVAAGDNLELLFEISFIELVFEAQPKNSTTRWEAEKWAKI